MKKNQWFTLTELIIGITISAVVLLAVFGFISNVMSDFWKSRKKTEFITTLYDFTAKVNEYKAVYKNSLVIDTSWGHDTLFLYNTGSTGVIFGVVDIVSWQLDAVVNSNTYWSKLLWYRELSSTQVSDVISDNTQVYTYNFFLDKLFRDMYIKWLQMEPYNTWALVNLDLEILVYYKDDLDGQSFDELLGSDVFQLTLTF